MEFMSVDVAAFDITHDSRASFSEQFVYFFLNINFAGVALVCYPTPLIVNVTSLAILNIVGTLDSWIWLEMV